MANRAAKTRTRTSRPRSPAKVANKVDRVAKAAREASKTANHYLWNVLRKTPPCSGVFC